MLTPNAPEQQPLTTIAFFADRTRDEQVAYVKSAINPAEPESISDKAALHALTFLQAIAFRAQLLQHKQDHDMDGFTPLDAQETLLGEFTGKHTLHGLLLSYAFSFPDGTIEREKIFFDATGQAEYEQYAVMDGSRMGVDKKFTPHFDGSDDKWFDEIVTQGRPLLKGEDNHVADFRYPSRGLASARPYHYLADDRFSFIALSIIAALEQAEIKSEHLPYVTYSNHVEKNHLTFTFAEAALIWNELNGSQGFSVEILDNNFSVKPTTGCHTTDISSVIDSHFEGIVPDRFGKYSLHFSADNAGKNASLKRLIEIGAALQQLAAPVLAHDPR